MRISRRTFLKGLGGGIASAGLVESTEAKQDLPDSAVSTKIKDARVTTSICPFCAVGCGLIAHTINGRLVNVEGDSRKSHQQRGALQQGTGGFRSRHKRAAAEENALSGAGRRRLGGEGPGMGD